MSKRYEHAATASSYAVRDDGEPYDPEPPSSDLPWRLVAAASFSSRVVWYWELEVDDG